MSSTEKIIHLVFGVEHSDAEAAAALSQRRFVRDQDHLAFFREGATGRELSALEAFRTFGLEILHEVWEYGSAIIVGKKDEPGATIRLQRERLGLSYSDVAQASNVKECKIQEMECGLKRSSIHDIERVCQVLSLDERVITLIPGAGGDQELSVRLRELRGGSGGMSATTVTALSESAWIAQVEERLRGWLGRDGAQWRSFTASGDYGSDEPVWRVGYRLAEETRRKLNLSAVAPIDSIRELLDELGIILVQNVLPLSIAGATIAIPGGRAIVANVHGENASPWTRRATIAHELGHLLWDSDERLNRLKVDKYDDIDVGESSSRSIDVVEARANAFAIAFLAPPVAVVKIYQEASSASDGLRVVMNHFGISRSAAKHHIRNSFRHEGRSFSDNLDHVRCSAAAPTEWVVRENMTVDYFPVQSTPPSRRGSFAVCVVEAHVRRMIGAGTAASYLLTDTVTFEDNLRALRDILEVS